MAKKMLIQIPRLTEAPTQTGDEIAASPLVPSFKDDELDPGYMFVKAGPFGPDRQVDGVMAFHEQGLLFFPRPSLTLAGNLSRAGNIAATSVAALTFGVLVPDEIAKVLGAEAPVLKPLDFGGRDGDESLNESISHPSHFAFCWADVCEVLWEDGGLMGKQRARLWLDNGQGMAGAVVFIDMSRAYAAVLAYWRVRSDMAFAMSRVLFARMNQLFSDHIKQHNLNFDDYKDMRVNELDRALGSSAQAGTIAWWDAMTMSERLELIRDYLDSMIPAYAEALSHVKVHDMGWLVNPGPIRLS